jgi:hypothetical protein
MGDIKVSKEKRRRMQTKEMLAQITKINKDKDYSLPFAPNDTHEDETEHAIVTSPYFPAFKIRGDIVYQLNRLGYDIQYVLTSIAHCEPNYCFAAYYLIEQNHEFIA